MVELLAGAALAVAGPAFRAVHAWTPRSALGWFGLFAIAVAAMRFDISTVFPGYMAMLPVLATVLVIVAGGAGGSSSGPVVVLRHPIALWIGRHSYAIYLWHWPVLVLAESQFGPLPLPTRLVLVAVAVGLSAISLRLVEDPVRHSPWLARRAARWARSRRHVVRHRRPRRGLDATPRTPRSIPASSPPRPTLVAHTTVAAQTTTAEQTRARRGSRPSPKRAWRTCLKATLDALVAANQPSWPRVWPRPMFRPTFGPRSVRSAPTEPGLPRRLRRGRAGERAQAVPLRPRRSCLHGRPLRRLARGAVVPGVGGLAPRSVSSN